jgi:hypothetical protein
MKRRTMSDSHSHMSTLLEDLERSLVIARALRAELTARTARLNRSAIVPRSRSHKHSSSLAVGGGRWSSPRSTRIRRRA